MLVRQRNSMTDIRIQVDMNEWLKVMLTDLWFQVIDLEMIVNLSTSIKHDIIWGQTLLMRKVSKNRVSMCCLKTKQFSKNMKSWKFKCKKKKNYSNGYLHCPSQNARLKKKCSFFLLFQFSLHALVNFFFARIQFFLLTYYDQSFIFLVFTSKIWV